MWAELGCLEGPMLVCQWAALPALQGMPAALGTLMLHGVHAPQMPPQQCLLHWALACCIDLGASHPLLLPAAVLARCARTRPP